MVEKPKSAHLHPKTTTKIRLVVFLASIGIFLFGSYVVWLAVTILKFTKFNAIGLVILMSVSMGVLIWLVLATIQRTSFRKHMADLTKYKVKFRTDLVTSKHH